MNELEKQGEKLLKGVNGELLKSLADTPEARTLSRIIDPGALQKAAAGGDGAALSAMLAKALSTGEGKKLAAQLNAIMGGK